MHFHEDGEQTDDEPDDGEPCNGEQDDGELNEANGVILSHSARIIDTTHATSILSR